MIAGLIVMTAVWWATPIAFTWYVLIGAVTTCAVAFASRAAMPRDRMSTRHSGGDRVDWPGRSAIVCFPAPSSRPAAQGPLFTLAAGTLTYDPARRSGERAHHLRSRLADEGPRHRAIVAGEVRADGCGSTIASGIGLNRGLVRSVRSVTIRDLLEHCRGCPDIAATSNHVRAAPAFETAICEEPLVYAPRTDRSTAIPDSCCWASRSKMRRTGRSIASSTGGAIESLAPMLSCATGRRGVD